MTDEKRTAIRERLQKLYQSHGELTPELVVKAAESPKSPLHDAFDWDDSVAAHKWRIEQARELIRSVTVVVTTDTTAVRCVAYVRNPSAAPDQQSYVAVTDLCGDKKASRAALAYECNRARALMERARHLALALGLASEVDTIIEELETLQAKAVA